MLGPGRAVDAGGHPAAQHRHEGALGEEGCAAFLSEPRFEGLPCIFEGPGADGHGVARGDMDVAWALREEGIAARQL